MPGRFMSNRVSVQRTVSGRRPVSWTIRLATSIAGYLLAATPKYSVDMPSTSEPSALIGAPLSAAKHPRNSGENRSAVPVEQEPPTDQPSPAPSETVLFDTRNSRANSSTVSTARRRQKQAL